MHKIVNGKEVPLTEAEIAEHEAREAAHVAKLASLEYRTEKVQAKRAREYPNIGDQLDAILKFLNLQRLGGTDLPQDLDDIVGQWLQVKQANPLPEE